MHPESGVRIAMPASSPVYTHPVATVPAHPTSAPEPEDIPAEVVVQAPPNKIGSPEVPAVAVVGVLAAVVVAAEQGLQGEWPHTDYEPGVIVAAADMVAGTVTVVQAAAVETGMSEPHNGLLGHDMLGVGHHMVVSAGSEKQA